MEFFIIISLIGIIILNFLTYYEVEKTLDNTFEISKFLYRKERRELRKGRKK